MFENEFPQNLIGFSFLTIVYCAWKFSAVDQIISTVEDEDEEEEQEDQATIFDQFTFDSLRLDQIEQTIGESILVAQDSFFQQDRTLTIVVQFINETQRTIVARPNDSIRKLKRENFSEDLSNGKVVRFIYQGRELDDNQTVENCQIYEATIIHCQISDRRTETAEEIDRTEELFDLSPVRLSFPYLILMMLVLSCLWYLRIEYRVLFKPISTLLLIFVSILCFIFLGGPCLTSAVSIFHRQNSTRHVEHR